MNDTKHKYGPDSVRCDAVVGIHLNGATKYCDNEATGLCPNSEHAVCNEHKGYFDYLPLLFTSHTQPQYMDEESEYQLSQLEFARAIEVATR